MPDLTVESLRAKALARMRAAYDKLCGIVADPAWTNEKYPPYVKACEELAEAVDTVRKLNRLVLELAG